MGMQTKHSKSNTFTEYYKARVRHIGQPLYIPANFLLRVPLEHCLVIVVGPVSGN